MKEFMTTDMYANEVIGGEWVRANPILRLNSALQEKGYSYTAGSTHTFYHYPARFSANIARTVIELFSEPGDYVCDPFMGGGTSIIEGVSLGRRMIGVDLNTLAHFVTDVRTTPLTVEDERAVRVWVNKCVERYSDVPLTVVSDPQVRNLPRSFTTFIGAALESSNELGNSRQQAFARCALLRLGQWALDCRDSTTPRRKALASKLLELSDEMLKGLNEFVRNCRGAGVLKSDIKKNRLLLCRNAEGFQDERRIRNLKEHPRLVFTSPPYPGVHVLYHRWQFLGRKETKAPYWIANVPDGHFESYYTGGSRTPTGHKRYFEMITAAFRSVRSVIDKDGMVVQLVGFSDFATQFPRYLEAMENAGFAEHRLDTLVDERLGRRVPNRKWYANLKGPVDASSEILLFHRPR